jgi:hypothetical protein
VLEIGCGVGRSLRGLNILGRRAVGVGLDTEVVTIADARRHQANSADEFSTDGDAQLLSYGMHLLRHLPEPVSPAAGRVILAQYLEYLKPGGLVGLAYPHERGCGSDSTHTRWMDLDARASRAEEQHLSVGIQGSHSFPRTFGRAVIYNELVMVARKRSLVENGVAE